MYKRQKAIFASGADDAFERGQEIQDQITAMQTARIIEAEWEKRNKGNGAAADPNAIARTVEHQMLFGEFDGLAGHEKWKQRADIYIQLAEQDGKRGIDAKRNAVRLAAADLGIQLPGAGAADPTQKRLYGAVRGTGGGAPVGGEASLSADEEKMARIIDNMKDRGLSGEAFKKGMAKLKADRAKAGG